MSDIIKGADQPAPVGGSQDNTSRQTTIETPMPPCLEDKSNLGEVPASLEAADLALIGLEFESEVIAEDVVPVTGSDAVHEVEHATDELHNPPRSNEIHHDPEKQFSVETPMPSSAENGGELDGMDSLPESSITDAGQADDIAKMTAGILEHMPGDFEREVLAQTVQVIANPDESVPAQNEEWPDIEGFDRPIELNSPALPSACLPERLEKLAVTIACALGVPLTYVVVSLLVCVAGLVGCRRRIRVTPGWVEPSTLAGVLVGPPGLLKSHVVDTLLESLRSIQASEHADYETFCRGLRARRDIAAAQEQLYKRALLEAVDAGYPTPSPPAVRLNELVIPKAPALVSTSGTPQGLRDLAARSRTGLLSAPDELPRFLHDHASPAARAFLMTAYDGRHEAMDLVSRGRIAADHFSISLLATIQPAMLPQVLGPDDGLLARFAWVTAGRGDAMPRSGKPVPTDVVTRMFKKIRDLVPEAWGGNVPPVEVTLEPRAAEVLRDTRVYYDAQAKEMDGLMASAFAKMGGLTVRLASAIDLASFGLSSRAEPGRVSLQSVEAATTLVETVLMPSARSVLGLAAGSIEERDARDLIALLRRRGWREVNQRDLQRSCSGRLARADQLDKAIRELAERGIVRVHRVMPGPTGGAPRKIIQVNPKALK